MNELRGLLRMTSLTRFKLILCFPVAVITFLFGWVLVYGSCKSTQKLKRKIGIREPVNREPYV